MYIVLSNSALLYPHDQENVYTFTILKGVTVTALQVKHPLTDQNNVQSKAYLWLYHGSYIFEVALGVHTFEAVDQLLPEQDQTYHAVP